MSSPSGSIKVIVIALLANFGIAIAKTFSAIFSGSASLFAEAIHSFVDCANQVLLPLGVKEAPLLVKAINTAEFNIQQRFPEIKWQFVEPDDSTENP